MILSGGWWLIIVLVVIGVLLAVALSRRDRSVSSKSSESAKAQPSAEMVKLHQLLSQHLPQVTTTLKHNRILVQGRDNRRLMLTIDKKLNTGSRQLGEAKVINFHRLPSVDVLKQTVQDSLKSN